MGGVGREGRGRRQVTWEGGKTGGTLCKSAKLLHFYLGERLIVKQRWVECILGKLAESGWLQTRAVHIVQCIKWRDLCFGEFGFLSLLRQGPGRLLAHFVAQDDLNF